LLLLDLFTLEKMRIYDGGDLQGGQKITSLADRMEKPFGVLCLLSKLVSIS
jgi:hypothetical protein